MKPYHNNPRRISDKQLADLGQWLAELGDLSGIVHDLNSDQVVGGNQRSRVFNINECEIVLTEQYAHPDEQGTVGLGYVLWQGNKYAYRQVRWDERQAEKANIVANRAGGEWDFDILSSNFAVDDLLAWGFEPVELGIDGAQSGAQPSPALQATIYDRVIHQPALNKKRTLRFLSACRWNSKTKKEDIDHLHAFKAGGDFGAVPLQIGDEIAGIVGELLAPDLIQWVTTPPRSHLHDHHFGSEVAGAVAEQLDCPFVRLFADRPRESKSHPRHYDRRGDLLITGIVPAGFGLLVDDVATSVTTLEECAATLRQTSQIVSFAWLYEDALSLPLAEPALFLSDGA